MRLWSVLKWRLRSCDRHVCPVAFNSSWGISTLPLSASDPRDRVGTILGPPACDATSQLATWTPHPPPRSLPGSLAKAVSLRQLRSLEDSQSGWHHFWGPLCSSSHDLSQTGHLSSGLWEAAPHQSTSPPEVANPSGPTLHSRRRLRTRTLPGAPAGGGGGSRSRGPKVRRKPEALSRQVVTNQSWGLELELLRNSCGWRGVVSMRTYTRARIYNI